MFIMYSSIYVYSMTLTTQFSTSPDTIFFFGLYSLSNEWLLGMLKYLGASKTDFSHS